MRVHRLDTDMLVESDRPRERVPARRHRSWVFAACGCAALIAFAWAPSEASAVLGAFGLLLLAFVLNRTLRVTERPLQRIADALQAIEDGRFDTRLPARRRDGVGAAERAFNRMASALVRRDDEARRAAYTDPLTGLHNRNALDRLLSQRLADTSVAGRLLVLFIDLDDFKRINDSLGHAAGDATLLQVAARLRACVALSGDPDACVCRLGGDEFVAIHRQPRGGAPRYDVAAAILAELQRPIHVDGGTVHVGASVGIACAPDDGVDAAALLQKGDIAMYAAKAAGKNCMRRYCPTSSAQLERRFALEQALRGAWERGELSVHFQPIYALATSTLVGAEALLRWQHPQLGAIEPNHFIEVAERCGLIEQIGQRVLQDACDAAARWPVADAPLFVAVNLSACQLRDDRFPDVVRDALARSGLAPTRLHIELTESAMLGDESHAVAMLASLRALGVQIWLDDFGTGYSRLAHLRRMSVDGLKIDRGFIHDAHADAEGLALASAIIALAHSLGIVVVAEGIETQTQLELMRARGCDHAQGYLLGKPMAEADFVAQLQTETTAAPL